MATENPIFFTLAMTKGQQVWDATGSPYWKVYLNTGSGFGPAMNWMVPQNGTYEGIYSTDLSGSRNWTLVDLDSDGKVDLIQTSDPTKGQVWDRRGTLLESISEHWNRFWRRRELDGAPKRANQVASIARPPAFSTSTGN